MAKTNNAEVLKKHHFWILSGTAVLFVLLTFVFLLTGVSSAVSKQAADNAAAVKTAQSTQAKGEGVLADLADKRVFLGKKKGTLWEENWIRQKPFFSWPEAKRNEFAKYIDLKFGAPLKETDKEEFDEFKRAYPDAYEESAKKIAPTQYAGGSWKSVLRWVPNWGDVKPKSEQIWLALEDLWVQRAVLDPIRVVNEEVATFREVARTSPLAKTYRGRVWELTLAVETDAATKRQKLTGKLRNMTPRMQLLGVGNVMRVMVTFAGNPDPVPFDIQGEFVAGDGEIPAVTLPTHFLPQGYTPTEITAVRQVLDARSVPVRRLDRLALGYKSAKQYATELKAPAFMPEDPTAGAGGSTEGMSVGGKGGGGAGAGDGSPPRGSPPGVGGTGTGAAAAGGPAAVLDANKKRYLEVTEQVRRVPVALVVVVDQMFIPDVEVAYSNSPFRFHIVQAHWRRFHGTIPVAPASGTGGSGGSGEESGAGTIGGSVGEGLTSAGAGMSGMYSGMAGQYAGMMGGGPRGPGMSGGFGGPPAGQTSGTVSEAQANAGLVELTLYGVVTLYEKYDEKKDTAADAPKAETPKEDAPKPDATKPDAPKDGAKTDAPKPDAPKDATKPDAPKGDAPKTDTPTPPKGDAPKDAGKPDAPKDAPKGETPKAPDGKPKT